LIAPHLLGQAGQCGGVAENNRRFLNVVFWVLRTGAPWRDLPPSYGNWNSVVKCFRRWALEGVWERVFKALIEEPYYEWFMIDASYIKVHPDGAGAVGGNQNIDRTKWGSTLR
jgi:transposase